MFKKYKPKNKTINAIQVSNSTLPEIIKFLMENKIEFTLRFTKTENMNLFAYDKFDIVFESDFLIYEADQFKVMKEKAFNEKYERMG